MRDAVDFEVDRVGVPAEMAGGFEQRDLGGRAQAVCSREAGDAASDDGDFHGHGPANAGIFIRIPEFH